MAKYYDIDGKPSTRREMSEIEDDNKLRY